MQRVLRRLSLLGLWAATLTALSLSSQGAQDDETLLLQEPTISDEHIVFSYAGDLWVVGRGGGDARRLTSSPGRERAPQLSPDGLLVAFTGEYEGNSDVYVMSIEGGLPRRLTWHASADLVVDWHPDGDRVLFASRRNSGAPVNQLFEVGLDSEVHGGTPTALELKRVSHVSVDAAGQRFVYTPVLDAFRSWKRYRGGRVTPIWIFDRQSQGVEVVPRVNASDTFPCWVDGVVYFASDRDDTMNLFRYRPGTGPSLEAVEQLTTFSDFDIRNVDAGGGVIVFEQGGAIHIFDPTSSEHRRLKIRVQADGLASLPRWQAVQGHVRSASVAPNGKRAVFSARGEIVTVPRKHGAPRNLTKSPGVHDRFPAWSPDGKQIAWFHDGSGEYALAVRNLEDGSERSFDLKGGGFYYEAQWSPDGEKILFRDKTNRLGFVDLQSGEVTDVASNQGSLGVVGTSSTWSPDSMWIAFEQKNPLTTYDSVALFEVASGTTTRLTDGFAAAGSPAFSPDGKLLYFTASVDVGPNLFGLDMSSSNARRWDANLYVAVLEADGEHPFGPRSDEAWGEEEDDDDSEDEQSDGESGGDDAPDKHADADTETAQAGEGDAAGGDSSDDGEGEEEAEEEVSLIYELAGIGQRILALPAESSQYGNLVGVKDGLLFVEYPDEGGTRLRKFDTEEREVKTLHEGVQGFSLSADGETLLFRENGGKFQLSGLDASKSDALKINAVKVWVDPALEWPEILREVWRIQRDYFYDPNMHGVDWDSIWDRYEPLIAHVRHRNDLTLLIRELIGELACGHQYAFGGESPDAPSGPSIGLLGADWDVDGGRYRIARILPGQNWNPGLRAPLTEPGVTVSEGDYLIAVDGREVLSTQNLYRAFEDTAGKLTTLSLSSSADGAEPRDVDVLPIRSESSLRQLSWVEANRRRVDELSDGRLAYIYMPNTGGPGREAFDRDFYSQLDKQGLILDERFNGGGQVADYVIDVLSRRVRSYWMTREGWLGRSPFGLLEGPKVMLINERAGSGGDWMPWAFQRAGLGPLVGTRTWGGLVGISGYPPLMDGGSVTAANFGVMDEKGNWVVENVGVSPDFEVIQWPREILAGRDPQLERAVELALEELSQMPVKSRPSYKQPRER